jgi:hypothetical protein
MDQEIAAIRIQSVYKSFKVQQQIKKIKIKFQEMEDLLDRPRSEALNLAKLEYQKYQIESHKNRILESFKKRLHFLTL